MLESHSTWSGCGSWIDAARNARSRVGQRDQRAVAQRERSATPISANARRCPTRFRKPPSRRTRCRANRDAARGAPRRPRAGAMPSAPTGGAAALRSATERAEAIRSRDAHLEALRAARTADAIRLIATLSSRPCASRTNAPGHCTIATSWRAPRAAGARRGLERRAGCADRSGPCRNRSGRDPPHGAGRAAERRPGRERGSSNDPFRTGRPARSGADFQRAARENPGAGAGEGGSGAGRARGRAG